MATGDKKRAVMTDDINNSGSSYPVMPLKTIDQTPTAGNTDHLVSSAGVKSALDTFVRPNLLDNWYFVGGGSQLDDGIFPINQRGQTSYTANDYTVDRWRTSSQYDTVAVGSSDVLLTNGSTAVTWKYSQLLIPQVEPGSKVTGSVLITRISGSHIRLAISFRDSSESQISAVLSDSLTQAGVVSVSGTVPSGTVSIRFGFFSQSGIQNGDYIGFSAVKLEVGDTQTLAHKEGGTWVLNEIPDYEEQLIRCKTSTAASGDTYANDPVVFKSALDAADRNQFYFESAGAAHTVTFPGYYRGVIFIFSSSSGARGEVLVSSNSSGSTLYTQTVGGDLSNVGIVNSSGALTITNNNSSVGIYVHFYSLVSGRPTITAVP
ncbi:MAG: hypothetical protein IKD63_03260 [Oscillospiraceae bacterium]|nr:hypothetical protein [Oscillospiraceae bacterium]